MTKKLLKSVNPLVRVTINNVGNTVFEMQCSCFMHSSYCSSHCSCSTESRRMEQAGGCVVVVYPIPVVVAQMCSSCAGYSVCHCWHRVEAHRAGWWIRLQSDFSSDVFQLWIANDVISELLPPQNWTEKKSRFPSLTKSNFLLPQILQNLQLSIMPLFSSWKLRSSW